MTQLEQFCSGLITRLDYTYHVVVIYGGRITVEKTCDIYLKYFCICHVLVMCTLKIELVENYGTKFLQNLM